MRRKSMYEILDMISVLWIILSTGSLYFCIFNMKASMIVLDIIAIAYLARNAKVRGKQFQTAGAIIAFVAINCILNISYLNINDDIIILLMRLFALMVIFSNISLEKFKTNYIKILFTLPLKTKFQAEKYQ